MTKYQKIFKYVIDYSKDQLSAFQRIIKILDKADLQYPIYTGVTAVSVLVKTLDELHDVRLKLKTVWPEYTDKLTGIYPSYDIISATAYYKTNLGNRSVDFNIQLNAPIEGFPISLGPNCGFKKVVQPASQPTETWVYSCEKAKDE